MDEVKYIKSHWGQQTLSDLSEALNMELNEILECAFASDLHHYETPNIRRRWEPAEEDFLKKYSYRLSIKDASNLLYRSYYATYQRVRYLGLNEMVKKR